MVLIGWCMAMLAHGCGACTLVILGTLEPGRSMMDAEDDKDLREEYSFAYIYKQWIHQPAYPAAYAYILAGYIRLTTICPVSYLCCAKQSHTHTHARSWKEMIGVLGHDSALQGYTGPGITWANGCYIMIIIQFYTLILWLLKNHHAHSAILCGNWCLRLWFCYTVRLYWAGDNLG